MKEKKPYQRYPLSVQKSALERMRLGVNVTNLAKELGVHRSTLYEWKDAAEATASGTMSDPSATEVTAPLDARDYRIQELESKVSALESEIGRATMETRFFKGALRRIEETRQKSVNKDATTSSTRSATGRNRKAN